MLFCDEVLLIDAVRFHELGANFLRSGLTIQGMMSLICIRISSKMFLVYIVSRSLSWVVLSLAGEKPEWNRIMLCLRMMHVVRQRTKRARICEKSRATDLKGVVVERCWCVEHFMKIKHAHQVLEQEWASVKSS